MDPARYDITIHQGATFDLPLQYMASGVPVDMTGYSIKATLWNKLGTTKLSSFSVPWVTQESGMFKLRLSSTVTGNITEQGQYDVLFTDPSGDKYYMLQGTAFIDLGLTGKGYES